MKTRLDITGRSTTVVCQGQAHRIEVRTSGKLILHGHRRWLDESAMRALRGEHESLKCFVLLDQWKTAFSWCLPERNVLLQEAFLGAWQKRMTRRFLRRRKHRVGS